MRQDQEQIKKAATKIGEELREEKGKELEKAALSIMQKQQIPKEALGMSDQMIEGIYGQAYRLYNTGKYKDASQLFRLLVMMNSTEPKYAMGLAACFHMMKDFKSAVNTYSLCGIIDPKSPVPHYHASDCYIQLKDPMSAMIALQMAVKRAGNQPQYKSIADRALLTIEALKKELKLVEPKKEKK
jgi:type III secretion system low calcium response chaperone LcrH/SycD